jgi:hypothetical protein
VRGFQALDARVVNGRRFGFRLLRRQPFQQFLAGHLMHPFLPQGCSLLAEMSDQFPPQFIRVVPVAFQLPPVSFIHDLPPNILSCIVLSLFKDAAVGQR